MREFHTLRNENGGEIRVHTVTDETAGSVLTIDGPRDVKAGDTLIATSNPNVFQVGQPSDTDGYDPADSDDEPIDPDDAADDSERGEFDPSENNADAVRRYLEAARERGDRDEFNRVVEAEQANKNRSTALVDYDR